MSSESSVKLIEDWRERWEPVKNVFAVVDTPHGIFAWVSENNRCYTYGEKYALIPKPRPKTYRPWKREEVPVGSVVRSRTGNLVGIIDCVDNSTVCISVTGTGWTTPEKMLEEFVLHRTTESGEWVPVEQCPRCGVEE